MCGLGRGLSDGDQVGPLGSILGALKFLRQKQKEEEEQRATPNLADPQAPFSSALFRKPSATATTIGDAPGVRQRRFRARTLGIRQLGVPLPGRLSGGLNLPDF